jgi:FKBP-type peptidyl-prolyl cis-trans isomerase FkpA
MTANAHRRPSRPGPVSPAVRLLVAPLLLILAGCLDDPDWPVLAFEEVEWAPSLGISPSAFTELPAGIWIRDDEEGSGEPVVPGALVRTHYRGFFPDGHRFDSSMEPTPRPPLEFTVGAGQMINGFDWGVRGMRPGGIRTVLIPPYLGYGARPPQGSTIHPNAWLVFEIHLREQLN